MAEEKDEAPAAAHADGASKTPLKLALANTVVVLAAMGMILYTRMIYKRPVITEDS